MNPSTAPLTSNYEQDTVRGNRGSDWHFVSRWIPNLADALSSSDGLCYKTDVMLGMAHRATNLDRSSTPTTPALRNSSAAVLMVPLGVHSVFLDRAFVSYGNTFGSGIFSPEGRDPSSAAGRALREISGAAPFCSYRSPLWSHSGCGAETLHWPVASLVISATVVHTWHAVNCLLALGRADAVVRPLRSAMGAGRRLGSVHHFVTASRCCVWALDYARAVQR